MSTISFPNLGLEFNPSRIAFSLFGKDIYWYGIIIAIGFSLAVFYGMRRAKTFGLTDDNILDMLFVSVPSAIVCARAYYCIFNWKEYAADPVSVLYIWEGGIAIYGAVIGAVAAVLIFAKVKKMPFGPYGDVGALGLLIGQMIGRWGNFINREAHGEVYDGFLKMGLENSKGEVVFYHPTFLYESIWNLIGFVLLHFYSPKRKTARSFCSMLLGTVWEEFGSKDSARTVCISSIPVFVSVSCWQRSLCWRRLPCLHTLEKSGSRRRTVCL